MNSKKILSMLMVGATVTSLMAGSVSAYAADNTETTEAASSETTEPLTIAEQGIFSAGGTTITSDGTFNPEDQWEETGAGQTSHVDHAKCFIPDSRRRNRSANGIPAWIWTVTYVLDDNSGRKRRMGRNVSQRWT